MSKAAQISSATLGVAFMLIISDLPPVGDATKTGGDTYCCGQAQDSFGLDLFCKSRNLDNASSVYPYEGR